MKKTSKTIVFFGSGPVAARSLELLLDSFDVEAVITKPKPDHHRGSFPVIDLCDQKGLKMFTASNKQELNELMATKPVQSEAAVLIDFGIIVSKQVIDYFRFGIINSHFSLLPEWRGADPITFSVLSGQEKTGVSLMLIDEGMDTGMIIGQRSMKLRTDITTPDLTEDLIVLSNTMLAVMLPKYLNGVIAPRQQPHTDRATYSRKLNKEDGKIIWTKPAEIIEREIRAFAEWPKSYGIVAGKEVVVTKAHVVPGAGDPGESTVVWKDLLVFCGEDALQIERLKPTGKNEMNAEAFINGYLK